MKLVNETVYNSVDLRIFFKAALDYFGGSPDKLVRVAYSRRAGSVGGHALLGRAAQHSARKHAEHFAQMPHERSYLMIALPGPTYGIPNLHEVAHVFEHELAHNRGLNHGDMAPRVMHWTGEEFPFVNALVASGFVLHREGDEEFEYVYRCPRGHADCVEPKARVATGYGHSNFAMWCKAVVPDGTSGWAPRRGVAPFENEDPPGTFLCGAWLKVIRRKKFEERSAACPQPSGERVPPPFGETREKPAAAAREGRTAAAEKREAKARAALAAAEAKLKRLEKRVKELRAKVSYYDRRQAMKGESK